MTMIFMEEELNRYLGNYEIYRLRKKTIYVINWFFIKKNEKLCFSRKKQKIKDL